MAHFFVSPQALSTYGSDSQMTSLLNQMDIYVLPVFNIDGYDYTHKGVSHNSKPKSNAVLLTLNDQLICCIRLTCLLCPIMEL